MPEKEKEVSKEDGEMKKRVDRACDVLSIYGLDKERNSCRLEMKTLGFCSTLGKKKFGKCVYESAVLTRKKIEELKKKWASELANPVTEETVNRLLDELKFATIGDTTLAELKEDVVRTCATVAKTVRDLLVCIDESQRIVWGLSSEF
jgi:hypothetical protein